MKAENVPSWAKDLKLQVEDAQFSPKQYTQGNACTKTHHSQTAKTEDQKKKKNPGSSPGRTIHDLKRNKYSNDYEFLVRNHGGQKKVLEYF